MSTTEDSIELIATAAFGIEATVKWELARLGYEAKGSTPGRLAFTADAKAIVRTNLHLRAADRVLLVMSRFQAVDFDDLYAGIVAIDWQSHVPENSKIIVRVGVVRSPITSARSAQSIVKRAIVDAIAGKGGTLDESGDDIVVDVSILGTDVTVSLATSGAGLHKRGYRQRSQVGQFKETLGAALVMICRWRRDTPLIDPFCGSGTIPIEAAMLASNRAPGLHRSFAAENWPWIDASIWERERELAAEAVNDEGIAPIIASDINPQAIGLARRCAEAAGVAHLVRFELRDYRELESDLSHGWIITNPPYGIRIGEEEEAKRIQRDLPAVLARLTTWSHGIFLGGDDFEPIIGQSATRRRKLYNAKIQCTLYQFEPRNEDSPAFVSSVNPQAIESFRSGLVKRARHLRKWPERDDVHAYRLFEGQVLGIDFTIDRFADSLRVFDCGISGREYSAHRFNTLEAIAKAAGQALELQDNAVHCIHANASVQRPADPIVMTERGTRYEVRPGDQHDPGFELSLRELRVWVARRADGAKVLDLTARPGVLAETVADQCQILTAWAPNEHALARLKKNFALNNIDPAKVQLETGDPITAVDSCDEDERFDLIFCVLSDADSDQIRPAFGDLLESCTELLATGGSVVFAIPSVDVPEDEDPLAGFETKELTRAVHPEDFKHAADWRIWTSRGAAD